MISNRDLLPALKAYFDRFASVGGDPALLTPVLGVEATYLRRFRRDAPPVRVG
jgi:hypothetical protein